MSFEGSNELATACRILAAAGQDDMVWGHASVRDAENRGVWMKPSGLGLDEIRPDGFVLVARDGAVLKGPSRRHNEYPIHTEIMARRPDVGAVVHTHAPAVVAFAALEEPLRPVSHSGTFCSPPDVPRFTKTDSLIRTQELGEQLAVALGPAKVILLPGHGLVTVGSDIVDATMAAIHLDEACRLQLRVMQAASGAGYRWTPDEQALEKRELIHGREKWEAGFSYLARRLPELPGD